MKTKAFLFLAAILITEGLQAKETVNIPSSKENFHLFLLMGQSNMSGGVGLAAGDTKPVPHVLKMLYAKEGEESNWAQALIRFTPDVPTRRRGSGPACPSQRLT